MNEVLMQDAQNLIEVKILPIVLVTFIARLVSVSVRPISTVGLYVTTKKYFCFFINATRSKKVNNLALQLMI